MNLNDPDVRQILRKKALQQAVAWGKEHNNTLSGDACFQIAVLINTTQNAIRREFGEEAYRETCGALPQPLPSSQERGLRTGRRESRVRLPHPLDCLRRILG